MNTLAKLLACAAASWTALGSVAFAADLRASPVTLEPLPGARTSSLTVINEEQRPVKVQIRVMRWSQKGGRESLEPTTDVVASPPFATLQPGQHYLVRVVRTVKAPPKGEESYRVLVDEVPDPSESRPGAVNLVLRQSIPAFFSDTPRRTSVVDWSMNKDGSQLWLEARNRGDRRLRLSDVVVENHDGVVFDQPGLVGYVLPGATMRWPVPADPALAADRSLHLRAISDTGRLEVPLAAAPGA